VPLRRDGILSGVKRFRTSWEGGCSIFVLPSL